MMWHPKQLLLAAARTSLSTKASAARLLYSRPELAARCFSSARPEYHRDLDDAEQSSDALAKKREALQKILKTSSTAAGTLSADPEGHAITATNDETLQAQSKKPSPSELTYTGGATMPVTSDLHIVTPQEDVPRGIWPVYRIMVCPVMLVKLH